MEFPNIAAAILGLFFGLLVWNRVARWVISLYQAFKPADAQGSAGAAALIFLHSGPWLLAGAGLFSFYVLSNPHSPVWLWFFGGALGAPPLIGILVLNVFRKRRKEAAAPMEGENVFPPWMRTKRTFVLRSSIVGSCVGIPLGFAMLIDAGAPTWVFVALVPVVVAFGALMGVIHWAFLGPALSDGKPFLFQTHPNARKNEHKEN